MDIGKNTSRPLNTPGAFWGFLGGHKFESLGKLSNGCTDSHQIWYTSADSSGNGRKAGARWLSGYSTRLIIEWSRVRIPLRPLGNFGNFLYPTLPVSFGRDTKRRWSLLSGVYARGSKISHTGGKCVTCCGLRPCSTWSIMSKRR